MKKGKLLLILIICSCSLWNKVHAVSFQASYLERTAQHLKFDRLDTLRSEANIISYQSVPVIIIKNDDNVITHIGYKIFAHSLRAEHPSPIYNYIEYALLDHKFHFSDNPFTYKDLKFIEGSWTDVETVSETTSFQIDAVQNRFYILTWLLNDRKKVSLQFPINYERLSLVNRKELEQNIIKDINRYHVKEPVQMDFSEKNFCYNEKGVAYKEGRTYLDKAINNNIYYQKSDSSNWSLMYSSDYPVETIANLCVAADAMAVDDIVNIKFVKYDYTKEIVAVKMKDFIGYMKSEGCVPFWGVESIEGDKIEGALFLYNKDKGFNHVLKIETYIKDVAAGKREFTATAYLLSPTTNVRDLNYQYNAKYK